MSRFSDDARTLAALANAYDSADARVKQAHERSLVEQQKMRDAITEREGIACAIKCIERRIMK